jgi:hypothetical protein
MNTAPLALSVPLKSLGESIGHSVRSSYGENRIGNARPVLFCGLLETAAKPHVIVNNMVNK